jgi:hypothetical protein
MRYLLFATELDSADFERRGATQECVPQKYELTSGGFVWLISAEGEFNMTGLSLVVEKNSPAEITAWLDANTIQESGI